MFKFLKPNKNIEVRKGNYAHIRSNIIGNEHVIKTPFGARNMMYADYVASGRAYGPIEDKIREHVLPLYANTHTEVSATGRQSGAFREQARDIIGDSLNVCDEDAILFCGSGCTGAIDKLINILRLKLPKEISKFGVNTKIKVKDRPVVFIGPFEHHSNDVQWRETIADVVTIEETKDGQLDLADLEKQLKKYKNRPLLVGSFSAASNVTGILVDTAPVAQLLHKYGALAAFDFAAAAPYIPIDMNLSGGAYYDAVFISPHKYLGGPNTPGLLVFKQKWAQNKTPVIPGGGTVSYVSPCAQSYLDNVEHREEGGTPDIIGAIRAGLAFDLQNKVGVETIAAHEKTIAKKVITRWSTNKNIQILGSQTVDRLPIFSFLIRRGDKYLHYNFVVALLNDMFGIQARGGCSCAGPYGHRLLDIDLDTSEQYAKIIGQGVEILKPGWARLGFNYFYNDQDTELLLRAVEWVADHGYKILPYYNFDSATGRWMHKAAINDKPYDLFETQIHSGEKTPNSIEALFVLADNFAKNAPECSGNNCCILDAAPEHLRWFSLAS